MKENVNFSIFIPLVNHSFVVVQLLVNQQPDRERILLLLLILINNNSEIFYAVCKAYETEEEAPLLLSKNTKLIRSVNLLSGQLFSAYLKFQVTAAIITIF